VKVQLHAGDLFDDPGSKKVLDQCLERNKRLAKWVKNPRTVPPELWPEAVDLARKAGNNAFFQSLIALAGSDAFTSVGKRKRKHKETFDPSSIVCNSPRRKKRQRTFLISTK